MLDNVDFTTSGTFRCEVSGDAPMFQTASTEGVMAVVGKLEKLSLQGASYLWCQRFSACFGVKIAPKRGEGEKREGVQISKNSTQNF